MDARPGARRSLRMFVHVLLGPTRSMSLELAYLLCLLITQSTRTPNIGFNPCSVGREGCRLWETPKKVFSLEP